MALVAHFNVVNHDIVRGDFITQSSVLLFRSPRLFFQFFIIMYRIVSSKYMKMKLKKRINRVHKLICSYNPVQANLDLRPDREEKGPGNEIKFTNH